MPHRRALAPLIRAGQELRKQLEQRRAPKAPGTLRAGPPRVPRVAIARTGLPREVRDAILAEAAMIAEGVWPVYGELALAFRESGDWRAHPISGQATPLIHWSLIRYMHGEAGGDVKQIWELNRHRGFLRLAQAWYLDRDPRWLDALGAGLDAWIAQNPAGMGINWASSLEVALRGICWTWIRALTATSDFWAVARDESFAQMVWHHGRHLSAYDSIHHSPNTHLTGEALGLVQLGLAWPDWPEAAGWARFGASILREELDRQLLSDGFHFELAPGYHRYTAEFYLLWAVMARQSGESLPVEVLSRLSDMLDTLAALRRPDGHLPAIGDEDGSVGLPLAVAHPRDPAPLLCAGAALFERRDWLWGLSPATRDLAWWILEDDDWARLSSMRPEPPAWATRSFPVAGYYVARENAAPGRAGWWTLVDAGPHGGERTGHAHTDLGHLELSLGPRPIVADPGSLVYTCDDARRGWDRSLAAHASLAVAGAPLDEPAGPFSWWRTAPAPVAEIATAAGAPRVTLRYRWRADDGRWLSHERQVLLIDLGGVVVADWLAGAEGHEVTLSWPLPMPSDQVRLQADDALLAGGAVRMAWASSGGRGLVSRVASQSFADTYRTPMAGSHLHLTDRAGSHWTAVTWFTRPEESLQVTVDGTRIGVVTGDGRTFALRQGDG